MPFMLDLYSIFLKIYSNLTHVLLDQVWQRSGGGLFSLFDHIFGLLTHHVCPSHLLRHIRRHLLQGPALAI
jgi:hypothetical protein